MAPKAANTTVAVPKGTKRAAGSQATKTAPPAKVPKKCPMLGAIEEVIGNAEGLPENCKQMLMATFPISVRLPSEERHAIHALAVNQVADIIEQTSTRMQQEIDTETVATTSADATKVDLESKMALAQSRLAAATHVCEEKRVALTETSKLLVEREVAVTSAKTAQIDGDAALNVAKADKEAYGAAYETNFKPLSGSDLDASEITAHFHVLQPLIAKLSLDDSLVTTIPSTLMKPHSARGSFEQMVIAELEGSLLKHIASLGEIATAAVSAAAERAAVVERAEQECDAAKEQKEVAASDVTKAENTMKEASVDLASTKEAVQVFLPEYTKTTALRDEKVEALNGFKDWNVQCFNVLKDKAAKVAAQVDVAMPAEAEPLMEEVAPDVIVEVITPKVMDAVHIQAQVEAGGA